MRNLVNTIEWIEIPAGEFKFGLSETQVEFLVQNLQKTIADARRVNALSKKLSRETPNNVVELEAFYISRFPITNSQYYEFSKSDHHFSEQTLFSGETRQKTLGSREHNAKKRGGHPAITHWHHALAFCDWIGARLPTSTEWEKAARGLDGRLYPWGNEWDETRGNFSLTTRCKANATSPVTAYPSGASPFGVMDLMGNVYEWTSSTILGIGADYKGYPTELVVCRGNECTFDSLAEAYHPVWFRNRVTNIFANEKYWNGDTLIGFRPILDKWQKQAWSGF